MLTGNVVIYLFGLPWLAAVLGEGGSWLSLEDTLEFGLYPFVPGDIFKLTSRRRSCRQPGRSSSTCRRATATATSRRRYLSPSQTR